MKSHISYKVKKYFFDKIFTRGKLYHHDPLLYAGMTAFKEPERNIAGSYAMSNEVRNMNHMVILAHPYLAAAKSFFLKENHVKEYIKRGYDVVIFDFNGFGESDFIDFDFYKDILAVFTWAKEQFKPDAITVHGISFGASQIVRAAGRNLLPNIKIIIENCLDNSIHYFKVRNQKLYYFLKIVYLINPEAKKEADFVGMVKNIQNVSKILYIYCNNDRLTTTNMGMKLVQKTVAPYVYLECPGEHLKAILDTENYMNFINDNIDQIEILPVRTIDFSDT
ncbi:MAG: alpha/beta fold hydrolase [Saprospiraceae bacterium]|nr:alpha/beta fold hydrolase [Saprospiraceae bacterium]